MALQDLDTIRACEFKLGCHIFMLSQYVITFFKVTFGAYAEPIQCSHIMIKHKY